MLNHEPPNERQIASNPTFVLRIFKKILIIKTRLRQRLFQFLPSSSFKMNYITIDYTHLYELLPIARSKFYENKRDYWETFFNLDKFETTKRDFHSFATDGISVSITLVLKGAIRNRLEKRPSKEESKVARKKQKVLNKTIQINNPELPIIGFDPGIRYMYTGIDTEGNNYKLSSKEWYHDIGHNRMIKSYKTAYKKTNLEDIMSTIPSPKVYTVLDYQNYLVEIFKYSDALFKFHFTYKKMEIYTIHEAAEKDY